MSAWTSRRVSSPIFPATRCTLRNDDSRGIPDERREVRGGHFSGGGASNRQPPRPFSGRETPIKGIQHLKHVWLFKLLEFRLKPDLSRNWIQGIMGDLDFFGRSFRSNPPLLPALTRDAAKWLRACNRGGLDVKFCPNNSWCPLPGGHSSLTALTAASVIFSQPRSLWELAFFSRTVRQAFRRRTPWSAQPVHH